MNTLKFTSYQLKMKCISKIIKGVDKEGNFGNAQVDIKYLRLQTPVIYPSKDLEQKTLTKFGYLIIESVKEITGAEKFYFAKGIHGAGEIIFFVYEDLDGNRYQYEEIKKLHEVGKYVIYVQYTFELYINDYFLTKTEIEEIFQEVE